MKDNPTRRIMRLLFRWMAYRPPVIDVPLQSVTLTEVTIVKPGVERLEKQTLVVDGNQISRVYQGKPQSSLGIRGKACVGGYVLPGLIDMHVHIPPPARELVNLLFLAYGVTTVRETGDADGTTWRARKRIQDGEIPGPRIFASGPVLDGDPPFLPTSWGVRNADEARDAVETLATRGSDFIKVHHKLSPEALTAIRQAAAEKGLRIAGHIPTAVPFEAAGVWDVQHLDGLVPYPQSTETPLDYQRKWRDLDATRINQYVKTSVEQGLVHTPTLISGHALTQMADSSRPDIPTLQLLPCYYRDAIWDRRTMPLFSRFSDEALEIMKQSEGRSREVLRRLHQAGVNIHLGTDTAASPFVIPGASLQQELELMAKAGLTIEEAWASGTRVAGKSMGIPMLGQLQKGAPADLLIFDEDPSRDLAALSTLKGVIAQGRFYSKEHLDKALSRHREQFEMPLYDKLSTAVIRLGMRLMTPGSQ